MSKNLEHFSPRPPYICIHNAHADPFRIQAIPCGKPCTHSTSCPATWSWVCLRVWETSKKGHTYMWRSCVWRMWNRLLLDTVQEALMCLTWTLSFLLICHCTYPRPPAVLYFSPSVSLSFFLPSSLSSHHSHPLSLSKSYISTHRSLRSQHSSDARLITAAGSADKSVWAAR